MAKRTKTARCKEPKPHIDPIYAVIEAHRVAETAFAECCAKYPNGSKKTDGPGAKAALALRRLCTTQPTTMHGFRSLISYLRTFYESQDLAAGLYFDGRADRLFETLEAALQNLVPTKVAPDTHIGIDYAAQRQRLEMVQAVAARTGHCIITDAELKKAMNRRTMGPVSDFCERYGQSLDWICFGDPGGMIASRIVDAGASMRDKKTKKRRAA
jgi:hypothetical protein